MEEGVLVAWHKKVGDTVKSGDILAEIETDKAVMEFESFHKGVLLYAIEAGSSIKVDAVIAVIGEAGEDVNAILNGGGASNKAAETKAPAKEEPSVVESLVMQGADKLMASMEKMLEDTSVKLNNEDRLQNSFFSNKPEENKAEDKKGSDDDRLKASPLAKAIAKEEGIDLENIKGSGDEGRIVKRDVEAALANRGAAPVAPAAEPQRQAPAPVAEPAAEGDYTDVPLSQMRKTIARRLGDSMFSAPHFYLTMEINMDKAMETRKLLNEMSPVKLSFNDIVVKATAMALRQNPGINASWLGDKIRYYNYVNMGVAVAVDEGLLVPVIRRADLKSLSQIAEEVRAYAEKAKDRKLQPQDMQGNTFTISNLGMFGIDEFTAIINPPDACILAVGGISEKLVMVNGEVKVTNIMKVTLSCDHRVVDGAMGAKFLQTLRDMLENPMRMLV
jgi:pyruvate dehydrogenase E2 component (dihydrolipoamide acetyltransferase)